MYKKLVKILCGVIMLILTPAMAKDYESEFTSAQLRADRIGELDAHVNHILNGKSSYLQAQDATGVPWFIVGIIHGLECGYNFAEHLANGDPLGKPTRHVPRGLVAHTWVEGAVQAFKQTGLFRAPPSGQLWHMQFSDIWDLPNSLFNLEIKYNGPGYYYKKVPSPYIWSFTTIYNRGKYVADGVYSPSAISQQAGAAAILKRLQDRGIIKMEDNKFIEPVASAEAVASSLPSTGEPAVLQAAVFEPPVPAVETAVAMPKLDPDQELANDGIKLLGAFVAFLAYHHYANGFLLDTLSWVISSLGGMVLTAFGVYRTRQNVKRANGV